MEFVDKEKYIMPDLNNSSEIQIEDVMNNTTDFWNENCMDEIDMDEGEGRCFNTESPLMRKLERNMFKGRDESRKLTNRRLEVALPVIQSVEVSMSEDTNPTLVGNCGKNNKGQKKDDNVKEKLVVISDCGACDFKKLEDTYPEDYMVDLYGNLHCCGSGCKDVNKTMRDLIMKGNGNCIWVCGHCENKENNQHNCQKMFCNICYWKNVGNSRRRRRN